MLTSILMIDTLQRLDLETLKIKIVCIFTSELLENLEEMFHC